MSVDAPETAEFATAAEEARERARVYRRRAWLALGLPLLFSALAILGALGAGDPSLVALLLVLAAVLQFGFSPALAILWFRAARREETVAARNEQAMGEAVQSSEQLQADAERLRQAAERDRYRQRLASCIGIVILLIAAGALIVALAGGQLNWRIFRHLGSFKVVLIVIFALLGPARWLKRRAEEQESQAELIALSESLGFRYVRQPVEAQLGEFAALPLFHRGKKREGTGTHLLAGELAGRPVCTLVYTFQSSGVEGNRLSQTVAVTPVGPGCPNFLLWPGSERRGVLQRVSVPLRLAQARQGLPKDLEQLSPEPVWGVDGNTYYLFGRPEDRERLDALLTPEVFELLGARAGTVAETANGLLAVYQPGETWATADYAQHIAETLTLGEWLDDNQGTGS
jgi:hypothetical protein